MQYTLIINNFYRSDLILGLSKVLCYFTNMDKDEILAFMVENGLLSVRWQQPFTVHHTKSNIPSNTVSTTPYPLVKFRKGLITESELCKELSIEEDELFCYLVTNGQLFDFS